MRANMEAAGVPLSKPHARLAPTSASRQRIVWFNGWPPGAARGRSFVVITAEDPDIRVHLKEEEIDRLFSTEAHRAVSKLVDRVLSQRPP
jgi:hypothetical protein